MTLSWIRRHRRALRWSVFITGLAAVATVVYLLVPAEPRWTLEQQPLDVFDVGDGRFATYGNGEKGAAGPLQLWDAATGRPLGSFLHGVPFRIHGRSDDGRYLICLVRDKQTGTVRIHGVDLHEQREWQAEARVGPFRSPAFSPRGDFVVLNLPGVPDDPEGQVVVETATGRVIASVEIPGGLERTCFGGNGRCVAFGFTDEEGEHHIQVVRTATGNTTLIDDARLLAVSPDSRWLLADLGDSGVWLWDVERGDWGGLLEGVNVAARDHQVRFDHQVKLWSQYLALRTLTSSNKVTSFTKLGRVRVWSMAGIRYVREMTAGDGMAFSPDSRHLLCLGQKDPAQPQYMCFDVATAKKRWERMWSVRPGDPLFTPDSRQVIIPVGSKAEILDMTTGDKRGDSLLGYGGDWHPQMARDGQTLTVAEMQDREPSHWLVEKIRDWLVRRQEIGSMVVSAFDLESQCLLGQAQAEETDQYWLTGDRRSLITVHHRHDENQAVGTTICGWDFPQHKPLRYVVGFPLGLGLIAIGLSAAWERWRRRSAAHALALAAGRSEPRSSASGETSPA
jgi:hypothetical protein